eukprot:TRINITY_DN80934_c0_g2_i2.p1 TRINITY_DN80934_c0_g2~~TRINITY_DN80934_c0_g2_i2.p1  ORF type:complete len:66 (-),score=24.32 TRINITY_DN80934_c0_g2_i2:151-348(-)
MVHFNHPTLKERVDQINLLLPKYNVESRKMGPVIQPEEEKDEDANNNNENQNKEEVIVEGKAKDQ